MHALHSVNNTNKSKYTRIWCLSDCLFLKHFIQRCFIYRPSDFIVSEDAGIKIRTVAPFPLAVGRYNHSARSHPVHSYMSFDTVRHHSPLGTGSTESILLHISINVELSVRRISVN